MKVVLSIAGSDSGGGAGIQADLKTFSALGVFGTTAIAAVTAQNSTGVRAVHVLPPDALIAQIDAVASDMPVAAVKIGMLATTTLVRAVGAALDRHRFPMVVVDPVMVAGSGDSLLADDAVDALRAELLPRATVLTPNLPEARVLLGAYVGESDDEMVEAARRLSELGSRAVLLKAGHRQGDADDILWVAGHPRVLAADRIVTNNTHGTGCTLSSALAAFLARGRTVEEAAVEAKAYVTSAIASGFSPGHGQGALHHFWEYYGREGLP